MERPIPSGRHAFVVGRAILPAAAFQAALSKHRARRRLIAGGSQDWLPHTRGFTFVEMMVVVTIILILISVAIPIYTKSIIRAKETVLHSNLSTLRTVIDNYTFDKQKAPQSLQDLVTEGYLRALPVDPMTGSNQWRLIMEDASQSVNQAEPGIFDVRSTSDKIGLDGTPYSEW